jgi:hypothetical protein
MSRVGLSIACMICARLTAALIPADVAQVRPGPVTVTAAADSLTVRWPDEASRAWTAEFSLDTQKPLLTAVRVDGKPVLDRARPWFQVETGKRRGGWDQFFDYPPSHPEGTHRFQMVFEPAAAVARTAGDRVEVAFAGLRLGPFTGSVAYTFYPGSRLVQQEAIVSTAEPDTAFYYDAGLLYTADADRRPGSNMKSEFAYYDTEGKLQSWFITTFASERVPVQARFRTLAARTGGGSVAVFPAPHQYFIPRDFTSNLGFVWGRSFRGQAGIGIRQLPEEHWVYYPWANAPPGTQQRLSMFLLVSDGAPAAALEDVLRFTNRDRLPAVDGYRTVATHWHVAYTVQAMEHGVGWVPPFKPVLQAMGVDAAMIMDFHGDGHPRDTGSVRLAELEAYYKFCRAQSDGRFLLIPGEEANAHYGGHWAVSFPKPVYWIMSRAPGEPFRSEDPRLGVVYRTGSAEELLQMVRTERGYAYQTHPRTKGSMGFPDKIKDSAWFRDPTFVGAGWKAMPSDFSMLRQGVRSLNLLDDMNNWGSRKLLLGEVDVFQFDHTHELYGHMNVNYVRLAELPRFDEYGRVLEAMSRGDYFVSTGEVLLPEWSIERSGAQLMVKARMKWTFPLAFANLVWSDGRNVRHVPISLDRTQAFGTQTFEWKAPAALAKWARVEVWDIAGNGAFVNPVWFE